MMSLTSQTISPLSISPTSMQKSFTQTRHAPLCSAGLPSPSVLLLIVAHPHLLYPPHPPNPPPSRPQQQQQQPHHLLRPFLTMNQSPRNRHRAVVVRPLAKHIRSDW